MDKEQLISEMLLLPVAAIDYHISQHLLKLFPDKALIENEGYLAVEGYAEAKHCTLTRGTFAYNQMNTSWSGPEPQMLYAHHMMHMGGFTLNGRNPFQPSLIATPAEAETHDTVNKQNRSFSLNELDGFASNIGIVTLATTNHPERLDPSILDRPSRFDRKYPFDLPELAERTAYISMWNDSLKPNLRLSAEGIAKISELTDGFSFAYLKELFLSSKMRWIATPQQGTMEEVMTEQVGKLREQMVSANMNPMPEMPEEFEGMPPMFGPTMSRAMRFQRRG